MTTLNLSHLELDDQGRAVVAGTRTKVILIVRDMLGGMTPAEIQRAYPYLSLAQIHAALAYYYDHKAELDAQIGNEDRGIQAQRTTSNQPSRAELEQRSKHGGKRS